MIILLIAGIAGLALSAFQLSRPRIAADRQRRAALESVRSASVLDAGVPAESGRRFVLLPRLSAVLVGVHMRIWRNESPDDITALLRRAGASRRLSAELFMGGRVALTFMGLLAGLTLADGPRRLVLAALFGFAGIYLPGFLLKKAATSRAERIDGELPNFVDQLSIAIEAGMSFDAALNHLVEAHDGPLAEEMGRIMTELRIGESRRTALRGFADRVGTESAISFANAVLASDDLGSPLAGILRNQAADLRHQRQMFAEERAQKAPVKMLFPIAIFILPVLFIVILAPAFLGGNGIL
jgi:tight adherence protein C